MNFPHVSLLLSLILISFLGAETQKLPHIEGFEDQVKKNSKVEIKTEAGHHFNQQSPLSCGTGVISKIDANKITCEFKKEGEYRAFLAVCDDAKKYCKIFRPTFHVGKVATKKGSVKLALNPKSKSKVHMGFKLGQPESTLEKNFSSKKPKAVLLDFFALWCPPCNDLDEMIFPTEAFKKESKDLEKIKINVDEEESWALKEKYKIVGYPTLIYLNSKGEEVGRFWGTQSLDLFIQWLQKMKRLEAMPISWAATQSDEENVKRVVEWNFDQANYQQVKTLCGARSEPWAHRYFLRSEASLASEAKDKKAEIKHLSMLMTLFPSDILYPSWLMSLSSLDKPLAEKHIPQALSTLDSWIARPAEAMRENFSQQDLLLLKADLLEALDMKDEMKKAQLDVIAFFEKELKGGQKISRGRSHILAYYYRENGRLEEAKRIYESLVKDNPQEFTFYHRYANALKSLKDYENALIWLEKGAPHMTEGNSRFQYSLLKGQLLKELGRKDEALQIVEGTLQIAKAPSWEKDSANRWIRDLTKLRDEIKK